MNEDSIEQQRDSHASADKQQEEESSKMSIAALLSAAVGLISLGVWFLPGLWFLPLLGLFLSIYALFVVSRSDGYLHGRRFALAGMMLTAGVFSALVAQTYQQRKLLAQEVRPVADAFFGFLVSNQPQKAYQLTLPYQDRWPLDEELWARFRKNPEQADRLRKFVNFEVPRTLLELPEKSTVRHYALEDLFTENGKQYLADIYAVTYLTDAGKERTFFLRMIFRREREPTTGRFSWVVDRYTGGVRPFEIET